MLDLSPEIVQNLYEKKESGVISEGEQEVLDTLRKAYNHINTLGVKAKAIQALMAEKPMSFNVAERYVITAMAFYNLRKPLDKQFLENWVINKLIDVGNDPGAEAAAKTKALATMLKHIEQLPDAQADPTLMESNVVGVVFKVDGLDDKMLTEGVIGGLTMQQRHTLLEQMTNHITPERAAEIMDVPYEEVKDEEE